jgi:hypothetical protein
MSGLHRLTSFHPIVALELTSPILEFDERGAWRDHIKTVMDLILEQGIKIKTNSTCGLHVHISPVGRDWRLAELQNISIAILHFEPALYSLLPPGRWSNFSLKPNSSCAEMSCIWDPQLQ